MPTTFGFPTGASLRRVLRLFVDMEPEAASCYYEVLSEKCEVNIHACYVGGAGTLIAPSLSCSS